MVLYYLLMDVFDVFSDIVEDSDKFIKWSDSDPMIYSEVVSSENYPIPKQIEINSTFKKEPYHF